MEPEKIYHIYTHANGSENLFRNEENYRYFLQRYAHFISPVAYTYAYCLMPNHLHFLVKIKGEVDLLEFFKSKVSNKDLTGFENLSGLTVRQFSHLLNAYTKAYNKQYQRMGSLFVRAFKRKEINHDSYLTSVIHYIHANPVHHGFTKSIADWPWSSYQAYILDKPSALKREAVLEWFGGQHDFIRFHQQTISTKLKMEMDF
ncbi:hypothetical protein QWY31_12775 [Cytophagales bacterium LB-30]|uniref:Transposase IS200-like domain-containing protein n=1 Tax=Shiella aurantiaca TaxID=3058365 RepID=A0ABT8F7B4_9BACT|nr:hypothetical protein [Shiella aurantiaca]MDN4166377.1 hypothetical protein [Shiella aurantiaca]